MYAPLPVAQFGLAGGLRQRQHLGGVAYLGELFAGLAAHPLRRRIGRDQLRMRGFQRDQLVHQLVELGVADLRIVEHVIAVFVVADLVAQRVDLLLHVFAVLAGMTAIIGGARGDGSNLIAQPEFLRVLSPSV